MWTFGRRIAAGFTLSFLFLAITGTIAYRSLNSLTNTSHLVTHTQQVLERIADVQNQLKDAETGQRGYIITGDEAFLEPYQAAIVGIPEAVKGLRGLTADNPNQQKRIDEAEPVITAKMGVLKQTIDLRREGNVDEVSKIIRRGEGKRLMDHLRVITGEMEREEQDLLKQRTGEAETVSSGTKSMIVFATLLCLLFIAATGFFITRSLSRQVGSAVQHVQSSSAELQTTANQQATGARESATAMNEVSTTMSELLVTSRQILESAQRVAHIAQETAGAARAGDETVANMQEAIAAIRRQVDVIVSHMLDLGKKSQQIGSVLDIINELSEQTNILSINATIEAAGAGEAGKRFAVVGDEIRKLAERVGGSTKEIRGLVEEIRSAVNATVLATEGGSKAVDAGLRHFEEVTRGYKQIGALVVNTTEAAQEIELATKQQMTAVEQVNSAIGSAAQAARETETSTSQTLQTATQLARLSHDLSKVIQPHAAAASA